MSVVLRRDFLRFAVSLEKAAHVAVHMVDLLA